MSAASDQQDRSEQDLRQQDRGKQEQPPNEGERYEQGEHSQQRQYGQVHNDRLGEPRDHDPFDDLPRPPAPTEEPSS